MRIKNHRLEIMLALAFALVLALFCHWQAPGSRMTPAEIDAAMTRIDELAPLPADEKQALIAHLRAWAEADDGQPIYMLNLMRYYPALRKLPGVDIATTGVEETNAHYESATLPILTKLGASVAYAGNMMPVLRGAGPGTNPSTNLITYDRELDHWNRLLLVRYPSRRAFIALFSDPDYLKVMPYKLASLLVVLTPTHSELVLPDPRLALGALLLAILLSFGWWRAERRTTRHH